MRPVWHPISGAWLDDLRVQAVPAAVRPFLEAGQPVEVRVVGDAMWPALRHGQRVTVTPPDRSWSAGRVVLCETTAGTAFRRIVSAPDSGSLWVAADADPSPGVRVPASAVLGAVTVPARRVRRKRREAVRRLLDVGEALRGRPDPSSLDPADTVRAKYDEQSSAYAMLSGRAIPQELRDAFSSEVGRSGRVLVVGCGTGAECRELASFGYTVHGVDMAPRMIEQGRRLSTSSSTAGRITFECADIRTAVIGGSPFAGVFFTNEVYSFVPDRRVRVAMLKRLAARLAPGGVIFASARMVVGSWERTVLELARLIARVEHRHTEWGGCHSRWIDDRGQVRRSFLQFHDESTMRAEADCARLWARRSVQGRWLLARSGEQGR